MSESSQSDRFSGLELRHDREWDYELDRITTAIDERDADRVGLQFPEGLKRTAPRVATDIEAAANRDITTVISGDPCYGSCDIDMDLARRADLFVHFGHLPMSENDGILYVPLFSNVDPLPILEEALEELAPPAELPAVGLVTTAQHINRFEDMKATAEAAGYDVHTRRGAERLTGEGHVLGCNYASADLPVEHIVYVGGGKFHPVGLAMEHPDKHVLIADPVNKLVTDADADPFIKQRYGAIHRAMDAESWGIVFSTKIGQERWDIAEEIVTENEHAHLISTDEVTPDRLRNFDFDAYVNTACPRVTTDDAAQFEEPLLTPGEYRIAIGEKPLDELSFDTYHGTW